MSSPISMNSPISFYFPNLKCEDTPKEIRDLVNEEDQIFGVYRINKLKKNDIEYVFLGKELGARSENPNCYIDGKVQYKCLSDEPLFKQGINRLCRGMKQYSIALMCAEKDPTTCHRMILVCREMRSITGQINHILANGEIETNSDAENRLMNALKIVPDMFKSKSECIEDAYDKQGQRIAYVENEKQAMIG